jgi:hypothetical protein
MSLLVNTPTTEHSTTEVLSEAQVQSASQSLNIVTKSVITHESSMSEAKKQKARQNTPSLRELLETTISEGKDLDDLQMNWAGDTVELQGVSKMALHSFILKAEELGKKITYTKTYQVSITD